MIVHVLHEGFAICGTMEGFPGEWPPGHVWTYDWDRERVTCQKCLKALDERTGGVDCTTPQSKNRPGCG